MQHALFGSVDELLRPATLSRLTGRPVASASARPLQADEAKSGSQILAVELDGGPRLVLKRVSAAWDWQMRATADSACRSTTLWQSGIFDRMPPEIVHGVLACARDGDGWAILMGDVAHTLTMAQRLSEADNRAVLDAMAALHAAFFEDPALASPALGLCGLPDVYGVFSPHTGRREAAGGAGTPQRIIEGWDRVQTVVEPDVARLVAQLIDDPTPLCAALARYPATLVHGDWRHANQGLIRDPAGPPRVVMIDWQLATAGPPSVELGRYVGANSSRLPGTKEATLEYYRQRLAARLGPRFDDSWWRPQLELGMLGGFIQDGWAIALKATTWQVGADAREHWRADLAWWSEQVRVGARWL